MPDLGDQVLIFGWFGGSSIAQRFWIKWLVNDREWTKPKRRKFWKAKEKQFLVKVTPSIRQPKNLNNFTHFWRLSIFPSFEWNLKAQKSASQYGFFPRFCQARIVTKYPLPRQRHSHGCAIHFKNASAKWLSAPFQPTPFTKSLHFSIWIAFSLYVRSSV